MILYRALLGVNFDGLTVYFQRWVVVRETPCLYWCVQSSLMWPGRKFDGVKDLKKVYKNGSRFAFADKADAYRNLVLRKRKHLVHLKNKISEVETFLGAVDSGHSPTQGHTGDESVIPGTKSFVQQNYFFD